MGSAAPGHAVVPGLLQDLAHARRPAASSPRLSLPLGMRPVVVARAGGPGRSPARRRPGSGATARSPPPGRCRTCPRHAGVPRSTGPAVTAAALRPGLLERRTRAASTSCRWSACSTPEGVRRRRGDARGAGRRGRGRRGLRRVPVPVQGLRRRRRSRPGRTGRPRRTGPRGRSGAAAAAAGPGARARPGAAVRCRRRGRARAPPRCTGGRAVPAAARPRRRSGARRPRRPAGARSAGRPRRGSAGPRRRARATASATAWKREEPRAWRAAEWARVRARVSWRSSRAPARAAPTRQAAAVRGGLGGAAVRGPARDGRRADGARGAGQPVQGVQQPGPAGPRTRARGPGCRTARPVRGAGRPAQSGSSSGRKVCSVPLMRRAERRRARGRVDGRPPAPRRPRRRSPGAAAARGGTPWPGPAGSRARTAPARPGRRGRSGGQGVAVPRRRLRASMSISWTLPQRLAVRVRARAGSSRRPGPGARRRWCRTSRSPAAG